MKITLTSFRYPLFLLTVFFASSHICRAQNTANVPSGKILQDIKKLNVLVSVLYIAAHPDDENNTLIAYLANEKLADVGYLSLTRGDGGQNLIGNELREELGILRTQELLAARKIDGGKQYFATANDFGFSKNPEETFTIWNKEKLLSDMVWLIRKTTPDVLITRYSHLPADTHGHHTASAILAFEAFDAAADPKRFPEQLKYVKPWQAKRLLWNNGPGYTTTATIKDPKQQLSLHVGKYNALLGKSYGELAAESRSMHKCQGMGEKPDRSNKVEVFRQIKGKEVSKDLFEDINTGWDRLAGAGRISSYISNAVQHYNPQKPSAIVPELVSALKEIEKLPESHWKETKLTDIRQVIKAALGLVLDATAAEFSISPGEPLNVKIEALNRSDIPVVLQQLRLPFAGKDTLTNVSLRDTLNIGFEIKTRLNENTPYSQPYWLAEPGTQGGFVVKDQQNIGLPENPCHTAVTFDLTIAGHKIAYTVPVNYKRTDPKAGEVYQPLEITPPVFVSIPQNVYLFPDQQAQKITVKIKSGKDEIAGQVRLQLPKDWKVSPESIPFSLLSKNNEQTVAFLVTPAQQQQEVAIRAEVLVKDKHYSNGFKLINYDHVPAQAYFPAAVTKLARIDLKRSGSKLAYIAGAGDRIPESLQQAGYEVSLLKESQVNAAYLNKFDAVIIGIRAFNVNAWLDFAQPALLDYVKEGGNLIVQYNTDFDLLSKNFGPYPIELSSNRVCDELAPVRVLSPAHHLLNVPNKISSKDFDGWVQDRGSYFPVNWSNKYETIFSLNDPGEAPLNSSLLLAKYGKGNYVYTTLSWFRQLPAGVPGAYRLFANLIGLEKN